jgi:hypothetical protein
VHTGFRPEMLLVAIINQGIQTIHDHSPDVTAATAVTAIGTAEFKKFFATERNRASTAISGADINFCLVEEFHVLAFSGINRLSDSPILRGNKLRRYATAILTEIFKLSQYSKKPDLKTAA